MNLPTYLRTAGPALSRAEWQATLRNHRQTAPVPAILDLLAQRLLDAYAETTAPPAALPDADARPYAAGRAAALEELFEELTGLLEGK